MQEETPWWGIFGGSYSVGPRKYPCFPFPKVYWRSDSLAPLGPHAPTHLLLLVSLLDICHCRPRRGLTGSTGSHVFAVSTAFTVSTATLHGAPQVVPGWFNGNQGVVEVFLPSNTKDSFKRHTAQIQMQQKPTEFISQLKRQKSWRIGKR